MVGKVPKHCRRSNHTVNTQQPAPSSKITKRCRRSNHIVNTQHNAPSSTVTAYNLRIRSDRTVNTQQRALSGTTTNRCCRSVHTVDTQQHAPSSAVAAHNLRSRPDRTVNDQQHALSGTTANLCRIFNGTVNTQHHAPSGPNTTKLCHRTCHNIKSQQHSVPGPLALIGKTPKLHRFSEHTVKAQQQTLSGSLVKLGKTPKLQVELPFHLVVYGILTRLPVKTLSRFRCVSKTLCSFISHPDFQKLHARRSQQTPAFLFAKSDTRGVHFTTLNIHGEKLLKNFSLIFKGPSQSLHNHHFDLVQSCLGLVCLRTCHNGVVRIFNPSTEEIIILPERPDQYFDLRVGFGYTDISDEFKVVRFFTRHLYGDFSLAEGEDLHNEVCFSEVFTLGSSHGWRETRSPPPFKPCGNGHLPLVHGALHFLPELYYHANIRDDHYVSAFDLSTEQYRGIPLPKIYFVCEDTYNICNCQMTELRGSLCMSFDFFKSKQMLQLWFLKDYHGGKWVKECNINLPYAPLLSFAFAVPSDGRALLSVQSSRSEYRLCYYNAQKKCNTKTFGINCSAMLYVDSFLPLPLCGKKDDTSTK